MGNDIATMSPAQSSALEAVRSMRGGFQRVASKAYRNMGGIQFARFDTSGNWYFGRENRALVHGRDYLTVNMLDMREGYTAWTNYPASAKRKNEKKGEVLRSIREEVDINELPQHKDALGEPVAWKPSFAFTAKLVEGDYDDITVEIAFSSLGGVGAVRDLIAQFTERLEEGEERFLFPIVTLGWEPMNTNFGERPKPLFDVVGWADVEGNEDPTYSVDDEEAPVAIAAPPPPPPAPVAPEGEPEPRRRRRTA